MGMSIAKIEVSTVTTNLGPLYALFLILQRSVLTFRAVQTHISSATGEAVDGFSELLEMITQNSLNVSIQMLFYNISLSQNLRLVFNFFISFFQFLNFYLSFTYYVSGTKENLGVISNGN